MNGNHISLNSGLTLDPGVRGPILTIQQFEDKHPGMHGRMRGYIMRSDLGMPEYGGLCDAVIRIGRTVMLDESVVLRWLESRTHQPKSQARNPHGRTGKNAEVKEKASPDTTDEETACSGERK